MGDAAAYRAVGTLYNALMTALILGLVTRRGEEVAGAEVELFAPLSPIASEKASLESLPMVRVAATRSAIHGVRSKSAMVWARPARPIS